MKNVNLHRSFKVACFKRGTTNVKIAKALGFSKQFITNITRNKDTKHKVNVVQLERIANHLDYSLGDFLRLGEGYIGYE